MGIQRLELGVRVRKFMLISVKMCCRSVWNHPFLVGLICFFMLLYTSFPLLFSALVTASPVLVCTAVLLGTLLSFGSPCIPEIEEKEGGEVEVSHDVSELKARDTEDHTVVEGDVGDDDFVVGRGVGKRWGIAENAEENVNLVDNEVGEVEEGDDSVRYKLLVNDDLDSRDIHCEDGMIDEVEGSSHDSLVEKKREIREDILGREGLLSMVEASDEACVLADVVRDGNLEVENHKLREDHNEQRGEEFNSPPVFSWKRPVDDEDESLDSDSDGAESSSPDASMADINLMLDELHPLLDSEAPQPAQLSDDGSDATSERSHGSNDDVSMESSELENQGEENNDEGEGEGEGGEKVDKEDESKSAIKWTEDDQKNLMDLGTSELERNQRLHNLIARRRARKGMGLMIERNLIDLDIADIPLNITPISVARRNPFEFPHDSYDDLGLPPIPGSAPTILQPRRNPFDLPYDSGEEKPDLKGDSFQEEFAGFSQRETVLQREAFLRRHESFNVGPSSLGGTRQELKWKPYFAPETEGSSPSSFQRQLSEVSESKLSFVPDTESVSSVVDEEDSSSCEQDISQENELIVNEVRASPHDEQERVLSGDIEPADVEQVENRDVHHNVVEITLGDGESQLETELNFPEAGASAHVELNGIEIEPMPHVGQAENRYVHHEVEIESRDGENQQEMKSNLSEAGAKTHVELNPNEIHSKTESVDRDFKSGSSLSLSETDEKILDADGEGTAGFEPTGHGIKESSIFSQASFEESEFHFTGKVVDDKHNETVCASSPSLEKVLSFSSISSDRQSGKSEMCESEMLVESIDMEPEGHAETTEQGISSFQKVHATFSDLLENEPRARDLPENSEHGVTHAGSLLVSTTFADHNVSMVPESAVGYVSRDAVSSSSDKGSEDCVTNKEESFIQTHVDLLRLGAGMTLAVDQGIDKMLDFSPEEQQQHLVNHESSKAEPVDRHVVDKEATQLEGDEVHSSSSLEHDLVWAGVLLKEEIIQTECNQIHLSNFNSYLVVDGHHDDGDEFSSTALTHQHMLSDHASSSSAEGSCHTMVAQVSQVGPSESNLGEVHMNESEIDQVEPTCLESKIDTGDSYLEGVSSNSNCQATLPRENPSTESGNQFSGNSTDEHVKLEKPCIIATESKVDIGNNDLNVHKVPESEDKLSTNYSSMISESAFSPSESPELTLPTDQEDSKGRILNEMESEGSPQEVSEHFNHAAEVYATYVIEENISEEDDKIKEIDEGILSELDIAGDFNVKKVGLTEGSHVAYTEFSLLPKVMKIETDVELPVIEARSAENIDSTFKQLHEGVDVEEVILPSMIRNQQDAKERSLEDIHTAFHQDLEPNSVKLPLSSDIQNGPSEIEQNDTVSGNEIEASNTVSGTVKKTSRMLLVNQKDEYEEASEKSSLNLEGKKTKSHDSSLSSSSSSSCSDSE